MTLESAAVNCQIPLIVVLPLMTLPRHPLVLLAGNGSLAYSGAGHAQNEQCHPTTVFALNLKLTDLCTTTA